MKASDSYKRRRPLVHYHVCVNCGSAFRREVLEGRSLTSGIFLCPKCGLEGPLNVVVREVVPEQDKKS